jgi:ribosomal protein S18 acetylase RimI-like enzyme
MKIRRALTADLPALAPMFDRYRQFYGQPPDPERASRFLAERLELNDLYVEQDARHGGLGRGLVGAAVAHARAAGAAGLSLSTGVANLRAQRLYESLGWRRQIDFVDYGLDLDA